MNLRVFFIFLASLALAGFGCGREERGNPERTSAVDEKDLPPRPYFEEPSHPVGPVMRVPISELLLKLSIAKIKLSAVGTPTWFLRGNNTASLQWIYVEGVSGAVPEGVTARDLEIPELEKPKNRFDAVRHDLPPSPEMISVSKRRPKILGEELSLLAPNLTYWNLKDQEEYDVEGAQSGQFIEIPHSHIQHQNITFKLIVREDGAIVDNTLIDYPVFLKLTDSHIRDLSLGQKVYIQSVFFKERKPNESDGWLTFVIEMVQ